MNARSARRSVTWRRWFYVNLQPAAWPRRGVSPLNKIIGVLIGLAVGLAILQSEPTIFQGNEDLFRMAELIIAVVFLAEYAARVWIAGEDPHFGPSLNGRLAYMLSLPSLIDLICLVSLFVTLIGAQGAMLRLFQLVRLVMLAKLGRYSSALRAIASAVQSRRYELIMSLTIAGILLLVSSTLLYMFESEGQPEAFGSIPRAMWWSIATLTTVGYGDVIPQTVIGRILAGLTAITGIGLIAMPTGILAASFSDALQKQREAREKREGDKDIS